MWSGRNWRRSVMFHDLSCVINFFIVRVKSNWLRLRFKRLARLSSVVQLPNQNKVDLPIPILHLIPFLRSSRCVRIFFQMKESVPLGVALKNVLEFKYFSLINVVHKLLCWERRNQPILGRNAWFRGYVLRRSSPPWLLGWHAYFVPAY